MNVLLRSLAYLLLGGAFTVGLALAYLIIRHEHRRGMARVRGCSR